MSVQIHPYEEAVHAAAIRLRTLENGWDEPSDLAPTEDAILMAIKLTEQLIHVSESHNIRLPKQIPSFMPDHNGDILICWRTIDGLFAITITSDGIIGESFAWNLTTGTEIYGDGLDFHAILLSATLIVLTEEL